MYCAKVRRSLMDTTRREYRAAILQELRMWIRSWLQGMHDDYKECAVLGLEAPYANYPFPPGFPLNSFSMGGNFQWIHEYGTNQITHEFSVTFSGPHTLPGSPILWRIAFEDLLLASFEIPRRLYNSSTLPFEIDPDLVIEALLFSLADDTIIHMASPTERIKFAYPDPYFRAHFILRNSRHKLIKRLERALVQPCHLCSVWLPYPGPTICGIHLTVPDGLSR
ncbi:hypothetical protein C8J57DRAFT_610578 [Mycena rebaudengoi]|nr:hypothetical protein C8J57DRAFT_610578 [Mycena rebaudengoi]